MKRLLNERLTLGVLILLTVGLLLVGLPLPWSPLLAFLLLAVWPLLAWMRWLDGDLLARGVMAGGLVLLLDVLVALVVSYWPGDVAAHWQVLGHGVVALLPLVVAKRPFSLPALRWDWRWVLLVAGITAVLRVTHLGYAEFQGDEGVIMVRAAAILTGDDGELFLHQKGPAEILLPLAMWQAGGQINEFWARLPFAWAGVLAGLAVMLLAREWFEEKTAVFAGLLFAIMGFGVAFGRIVQYQNLVMLWGTLAVWQAVRYGVSGERRYLWGTAVFLASGLLAHYDAILVTPAIAWLLVRRWWQNGRIPWTELGKAVGLGGVVLFSFYAPFVLNPNFGRTGQYLLRDRLGVSEGSGWISWSGTAVWRMLTFYNSTYYIVAIALLAVVGVWWLVRQRQHFGAVLLFIIPLLFYLFVVADPRTHVYTLFPGWLILAGLGTAVIDKAVTSYWRIGWRVVWVLVWLVSGWYVYLMLVDHTPERQRTWAENRPSFYPVTWDEPPLFGLFGFPHQAGWRLAAQLLTAADFPYASNEEEEITNWYMAQAPRTHCPNFQTFIRTFQTQDELPYNPDWLQGMSLRYEVLVNGRLAMQIFTRQPVDEVTRLEAEGIARWLTPEQAAPPTYGGQYPVRITLGGKRVQLLGYDVDKTAVSPGEQLTITLYWLALTPFERNYQVFTHLFNGQLIAQHDGAPECAINPTTRWEPGQIIPDPHTIPIPPDAPAGTVSLLAGMYDLITGERMSLDSDPSQTVIHLQEIEITPK